MRWYELSLVAADQRNLVLPRFGGDYGDQHEAVRKGGRCKANRGVAINWDFINRTALHVFE